MHINKLIYIYLPVLNLLSFSLVFQLHTDLPSSTNTSTGHPGACPFNFDSHLFLFLYTMDGSKSYLICFSLKARGHYSGFFCKTFIIMLQIHWETSRQNNLDLKCDSCSKPNPLLFVDKDTHCVMRYHEQ